MLADMQRKDNGEYPVVLKHRDAPPEEWRVYLPGEKGTIPFLACRFIRIDKSWHGDDPSWWEVIVASINRDWSDDPTWWEPDFTSARRFPFPC